MTNPYTKRLVQHAIKVENTLPASGVKDTIEAMRKEIIRLSESNDRLWDRAIKRDGFC